MESQFQRGEIYLADLSNAVSSEQRGIRPGDDPHGQHPRGNAISKHAAFLT